MKSYIFMTNISLISTIFVLFNTTACDLLPVNQQVFIETEDATLYANIRGRDEKAPVLLYLHGGPGSPLGIPLLRAYAGPQLEESFILIYLHQRGIMKSPRVPDSTHTLNNYVNDIHHVVQFLKKNFAKRDIYLLGHSWGGVLGYLYLLENQNDIKKFVAVCTPINAKSMIFGRIDMILKWAESTNNQKAIKELTPLKDRSPHEHAADFKILGKWMSRAHGGWHRNLDRARINQAVEYEDLLPKWLDEQQQIEDIMQETLLQINLEDRIQEIKVPLLCIVGKEDVDVPWYLVEKDIKKYGGEKTFVLFKNSHHMVFIDEEDLFISTVVKFLKS